MKSMAWQATPTPVLDLLPSLLTTKTNRPRISRLPIAEVVLALSIGKLAKYLLYAWLASRFPERALQRGRRHADALRAMLARAKPSTPTPKGDVPTSGEVR